MDCPGDNTVAEFVEGTLPVKLEAQVEAHIDACAHCRALVSGVADAAQGPPNSENPAGVTVRTAAAPSSNALPQQDDRPPVSAPTVRGGHRRVRIGDGVRKVEIEASDTIALRYRLERELGRGGMGAVWVAHDRKLRRLVAVKLLRSKVAASQTALARFEREAMAVARLRSPHIVQVYDYGVDRDRPYMVMELLEGEDLKARMRRYERFPLQVVANFVLQIAKALSTAHEAGIVHRDLKPANIFLTRDQEDELVKVVDFGVAKALTRLGAEDDATAEGVLIGTPRYMSPEQAHGAKRVDHRADLWSLAVIAFQALTGTLPFSGRGVGDVITKINTASAPAPSSLVPGLGDEVDLFFARALAKQPRNRYQSARSFAADFAAMAGVDFTTTEFVPPAKISDAPPDEDAEGADATLHAASRTVDNSRVWYKAAPRPVVFAAAAAAGVLAVLAVRAVGSEDIANSGNTGAVVRQEPRVPPTAATPAPEPSAAPTTHEPSSKPANSASPATPSAATPPPAPSNTSELTNTTRPPPQGSKRGNDLFNSQH